MHSSPDDLSIDVLATPTFVESLVASEDVDFVDKVARVVGVSWAVSQSATLIACYRMKMLFNSMATRSEAQSRTNYSSWSEWLHDLNLPISVGLVRTRALEIGEYIRLGASWHTVANILAYAPTAGADVLSDVVDRDGDLLPHINEEDLPGGSVQGLLDAISALPNPGQARSLVSGISTDVRVYATRCVYTGGSLYASVTIETDQGNEYPNIIIKAKDDNGSPIPLGEPVAAWIAESFGKHLEIV